MAKIVLGNAYAAVASNNLSGYIESVEISEEVDLQEATVMGDAAKRRLAGLKDWTLTLNFRQDVAGSAIDSILHPLFGTEVTVEIRAVNTTVGSDNPKFTGSGILSSYQPVGGSVGQTHNGKAVINCSNGAALTRATS